MHTIKSWRLVYFSKASKLHDVVHVHAVNHQYLQPNLSVKDLQYKGTSQIMMSQLHVHVHVHSEGYKDKYNA